jgi:hypothetical protein
MGCMKQAFLSSHQKLASLLQTRNESRGNLAMRHAQRHQSSSKVPCHHTSLLKPWPRGANPGKFHVKFFICFHMRFLNVYCFHVILGCFMLFPYVFEKTHSILWSTSFRPPLLSNVFWLPHSMPRRPFRGAVARKNDRLRPHIDERRVRFLMGRWRYGDGARWHNN